MNWAVVLWRTGHPVEDRIGMPKTSDDAWVELFATDPRPWLLASGEAAGRWWR